MRASWWQFAGYPGQWVSYNPGPCENPSRMEANSATLLIPGTATPENFDPGQSDWYRFEYEDDPCTYPDCPCGPIGCTR